MEEKKFDRLVDTFTDDGMVRCDSLLMGMLLALHGRTNINRNLIVKEDVLKQVFIKEVERPVFKEYFNLVQCILDALNDPLLGKTELSRKLTIDTITFADNMILEDYPKGGLEAIAIREQIYRHHPMTTKATKVYDAIVVGINMFTRELAMELESAE